MNSENFLYCTNCGQKNQLYLKNCNHCKHYLRSAVANIDLWKTIWQLFESPKIALKNIVFSDHKNFVMILLLLLSTKLFVTAASAQTSMEFIFPNTNYFYYNFLLLISIYSVTVILFVLLFTFLINRRNKSRIRDNLSIIAYSFIPFTISLFILTPVEYSIFGKHWFISNPSPFIIKTTLAYIMLILELIMVIWSVQILYKGFRLQTNSLMLSLFSLIVFIAIITAEIIYIPFILL